MPAVQAELGFDNKWRIEYNICKDKAVWQAVFRFLTGGSRFKMDNLNFLNAEDLESVLEELDGIESDEAPLTEEERASQRRYEEIIKKHKEN